MADTLCPPQNFINKSNTIITSSESGVITISNLYGHAEANQKLANTLDFASQLCDMTLSPDEKDKLLK